MIAKLFNHCFRINKRSTIKVQHLLPISSEDIAEKGIKVLLTFGAIWFFFTGVIPTLGLAIAQFVIAGQNTDIDCDDGAVVALSTWLYACAAVSLASSFSVLCLLGFMLSGHIKSAASLFCCIICPSGFFLLAWNIVGAVALFRDSEDCMKEAESIWIMVLVVLCFQWAGMIANSIKSHYQKQN